MKVILIIDADNEELIGKMGESIRIFNDKYKCNWKLKPLPQRKEELYYPCNEYVQTFNEGYNRCIDDMLGDTEDE